MGVEAAHRHGAGDAAGLIGFARRGWLARGQSEPGLARSLARQGAPMALGWAGEGGAWAVVGLILGLFGAATLAAHPIVAAVRGVLHVLPMGVAAVVTIRAGQAPGAGAAARLRPILGAARVMVSALNLGVTLLLPFLGAPLLARCPTTPRSCRWRRRCSWR